MKNTIRLLFLTFFIITLSFVSNVKSEELAASIGISCPKTELAPTETVTCDINVTSDKPYNAVLLKSNTNIKVQANEGFELKESGYCEKCVNCNGEAYGCKNNYLFLSKEEVTTSKVGTVTITAPQAPGKYSPITLLQVGSGDYDKLLTSSNPTIEAYNNTSVIPTFTVLNPLVIETSFIDLEVDCPKTELKVNESMSCSVKLTTQNKPYNVVMFESLQYRNISLTGLNNFDAVKNEQACKKCIGCGCIGRYSFITRDIVKEDGTVEIGKIEVTAPQETGAYNLTFSTVTIGRTTYEGYNAYNSKIEDPVAIKNVTKVINVVKDEEPVEEPTPTPTTPQTTYKPSSDNKISSLTLTSNGVNIPVEFDINRTTYNINVASSVSSVNIGAKLNNSKAKFLSDYSPRTVNLSYGLNIITLKVQAEDKSIKTYTINITRTLDSNKQIITSIVVNNITIPIEDDKYDYYVEVGSDVTYSKIIVNLNDESYLTSFSNIDIKEGNNDVTVRVTDLKNNNINYHITIYKAPVSTFNISDVVVPVIIIVLIIIIFLILLNSLLRPVQSKPKNKKKK